MYTSADLISSIKLRGVLPSSQNMYTDEKICMMISQELQSNIVPWILSFREDYYLTYEDFSIAANQTVFEIPELAIGGKLKAVMLLDGNSNILNSAARLSLKQIADYTFSDFSGFYVEGNYIKLYPNTYNAQTLRLYYFRRPNDVVPIASAGQVMLVDSLNKSVVLSNVPSDWVIGTLLSVVKGRPGFDAIFNSTAIVSLSSPTVELSSVAGIKVGDWFALKYFTPVIMAPVEAQAVLAQVVVSKLLEGLGDPKWQSAQEKATELKLSMTNTLAPRVDDSPKKIVSRNFNSNSGPNQFRGY